MSDKFLSFLDFVDGGGKGTSGSSFEGGGLLSSLGNALFKPAGYAEREKERLAGIRPQSRPQRVPPSVPPSVVPTDMQRLQGAYSNFQIPTQQGVEPIYPDEMPVGGALPQMAVAPAANNQTLNLYPSEQDLGRLDQLHGEYSPAYRHYMLEPQLNRNSYNMAPNSMGMNQNVGFQEFLSEMKNDQRYDPRYVNEQDLYEDYIKLGR